MGSARVLAIRGGTLFGVLIIVLLILVVSLGATGVSDKILNAIVSDDLRQQRQSLAQTIRDPTQLENALAI
ncbi:MAG: ABC transporter permease, partial [Thaumarchaeota archaeon]|nr:ABC transporter permease [Nitrososphaerota archaeon]